MAGRFGAVLTAMVTPFDQNGDLDLDEAARLARWLTDHGSDGLVVAGTTGEAPVLTDEEKLDLWRAVAEAVTGPVIAGTGSNDTRHTVELTARAAEVGAAGVLLVGPYYNKPSQAGIDAHLRAAAGATTLPVMIYDVPGRTGKRIAPEVLRRLFTEVPNAIAFKDATGDPAGAAHLVATLGDDFDLYSGDDSLTLPLLAVGAKGVVGVSTHWAGEEMAEMIAAFEKGDVQHAREVNARMLESFAFANTDAAPYSVATKAMMRTLGLRVGECRLPNGPTPPGVEDRAREVYAALRG
ncbi:MAG TPA: 4-hydroxy-tetrahydrodipicolinate synthase [Acidimicrobiales bacterium]|nr:4-hydroxy-tetrahydrodipicolinate synthase [Acidimicrobiales bacterium]